MMAAVPTCPRCETPIRDDYGMVTCPQCAVVLFVDMEGVAHAATEEPGSARTNNSFPKPDLSQSTELSMDQFLGAENVAQTEDPIAAPTQFDPTDPLGISAYANSEISSAKDGPLVVTVLISGIDTKDLRQEIRQALQDSRFGWDADSIFSAIRGGTLALERISPVKATIFINRIKNLAVQIRWEQSAITELDLSDKDIPS